MNLKVVSLSALVAMTLTSIPVSKAQGPGNGGISGQVTIPISSTTGSWECLSEGTCEIKKAIYTSMAFTTIALMVTLKEDIRQVEPDAYEFLAGEPMSLALQEMIDELRLKSPELRDFSDEDVSLMMLEAVSQN